ncbi:periplasmic binding protein-like I, partial [Catenaria anguillulae PL171]
MLAVPMLTPHPCGSLLVTAMIVVLLIAQARGATFNIAVNLPFLTPGLGKAVTGIVAFLKANEVALDTIDPSNTHSFRLIYTASNYTALNATLAIQNAITRDNVVGMVGDWTSSMTIPQALASARDFTWVCSGSATSDTLSDKVSFPYTFRTIMNDAMQGRVLAGYVKYMGWRTASVLASSDAYGTSISTAFISYSNQLGITITATQVFQPTQTNFQVALDAVLNSGSQIIVVTAIGENTITLLRQAKERGMIGDDWVWIGPEVCFQLVAFLYARLPSIQNDLDLSHEDRMLVNGMQYVYPRENSYNTEHNATIARFQQQNPGETLPPAYSFLFFDCVKALAAGILRVVNETGVTNFYARNYFPNLGKYFLQPFDGVTGHVTYDEVGNRQAFFQVMNWFNNTARPVFDVDPHLNIHPIAPVKFFSGTSKVPKDRPDQVPLIATLESTAGKSLLVANIMVGLSICVIWLYLLRYRYHTTVRSLSFPFLSLITLGCLMIVASNITSLGVATTTSCQVSLFVFVYGVELILASSTAKAYRLYRIYDNVVISVTRIANAQLLGGLGLVMLGQTFIFIAWIVLAPVQSILISARTYYYFRCASQYEGHHVTFSVITTGYNLFLLLTMMVFGYKTRNIAKNYRETAYILYVAQNTLLSGLVVGSFHWFAFGESTLSAFVFKQCTILYAVNFAFFALVGRIALVTYMSNVKLNTNGAGLANQSNHLHLSSTIPVKTFNAESPSPSNNPSTGVKVSTIDGKVTTIRGTYSVKRLGSLLSTWVSHHVTIHAADGYLTMLPARDNPESGIVLRLCYVHYDPSPPGFDNCLELSTKGKGAYLIQFTSEEERTMWVSIMGGQAAVNKRNTTGAQASSSVGRPRSLSNTAGVTIVQGVLGRAFRRSRN